MKPSTQTLLLLLLFSLSILTFSEEVVVHVTKSYSTTKHFPSSGSGSNNEETTETEVSTPPPAETPSAEGFQACDPNNRQQACTLEYLPVCSYVHNCEGGACTITSGNACTACAQSNVDGYVEGACEDIWNVCDIDERPIACPLIYTPTCAVAGDCQGSHCLRDASNSCEACSLQGVAYSLPGACPPYSQGDRTFCDPQNRPEICTADYTPVCAHVANCVGNSCYFTAGNACSACGDATVNWHTPGECSPNESRTYCDPNNQPEICTADYTPVCAHRENCQGDGDDCFFTAGNACSACGDATVDWHYPGECPSYEENDEDNDEDNGEDSAS